MLNFPSFSEIIEIIGKLNFARVYKGCKMHVNNNKINFKGNKIMK